MKIFKNLTLDQFIIDSKKVPSSDEVGYFPNQVEFNEFFIVKPDNLEGLETYPEHVKFLVYVRERFLSNDLIEQTVWHFQGAFSNLKTATSYAMFKEGGVSKWEYFFQENHEPFVEGTCQKNPSVEVMGQLGWELCAIDGKMTIYKRKKVV